MKKNEINWLKEASLWLGYLIFLTYTNTYLYQYGYSKEFGIPLAFISITLDMILNRTIYLLLIFIACVVFLYDVTINGIYVPKFFAWINNVLFLISGIYFLLFFEAYAYSIGIFLLYTLISILRSIKFTESKKPDYFMKYPLHYIALFTLMIFYSGFAAGEREASEKEIFNTIKSDSEYVIISWTGENILCANLDSNRNYTSFKLFNYSEISQRQLSISKNKIGKIKYIGDN